MEHPTQIRNFSIIAHIDHGKSTLADRLLERTGAISEREMREQFLDTMDLERERGITIKAQAVRLDYLGEDGQQYVYNLIDTPGHVDFSYEVSRSLAACEGAVLLADAAQGIQAQTLANAYQAVEAGLEIIPVVNKIDLAAADPNRVAEELAGVLGSDPDEVIRLSAKTGQGVEQLLSRIAHTIPAPRGERASALQALIFDTYYDPYRGVICYLRVMEGQIENGQLLKLLATGENHPATEIGVLTPRAEPVARLGPGEVGYLITGQKEIDRIKVGDTITSSNRPSLHALPGYREPKPMVFAGIYPTDGDEFEKLREALDKLALNDAALVYEPETSRALGFGFRCGFLGLLHLEICQERLEREYDLDLVTTAPSVAYQVETRTGQTMVIRSPQDLPTPAERDDVQEPYVQAMIISPTEYIGAIMDLVQSRRGTQKNMHYLGTDRVELTYLMPLAEVVIDFYDRLKSRTQGYASLDYEEAGYQSADLVRVDVLLNKLMVDAFSSIVHQTQAYRYGKAMTERLSKLIPRQLFDVPIQAAIGGRIIARETVKAKRKDVLAKCYGGDVTRKRKLLERQKEGKRRMKMVGSVEVPQAAFIDALRVDK